MTVYKPKFGVGKKAEKWMQELLSLIQQKHVTKLKPIAGI